MSENIDTIVDQLKNFGISEEESHIYLAIYEGMGETALQLSRYLRLARTKVYRILDNLVNRGLVLTHLGERGTVYSAIPEDQLELLLKDKEYELEKLKSTLPHLQESLKNLGSTTNSTPQITYYHGQDGIKQVTYNSLRAKGELLTYELNTMDAFFSHEEAEDYRRRFVENKIYIHTLTNATHMKAWTDVSEIVEKYCEIRHLPPLGNPFQFEILIYNDVYCMYRYVGGEVFCIEIKSQELADMQKQIFEYMWRAATPMQVLNSHGEAIVKT